MATLLHCPFCGAEPVERRTVELYRADADGPAGEFDAHHMIACDNCGIDMSAEYRDDATAAWNTRAQMATRAIAPREAGEAAFYECEGNNEACLKAAFDAYEASAKPTRADLVRALTDMVRNGPHHGGNAIIFGAALAALSQAKEG